VEPSQEAEEAWVNTVVETADIRTEFFEECTPGYRNGEGKVEHIPSLKTRRSGLYGPGAIAFYKVLRDWREAGDQAGLEFRRHGRRS
jgi:cyclohexanone monooxygenase